MFAVKKEPTSRVLVLDDEPAFRVLAERYLQQHGFLVHSSSSLEEAKLKLETFKAQVILLDMTLPNVSWQQSVQSLAQISSCPLVVLHTQLERSEAFDAIRSGAWDMLAKPLEAELLAMVVKRALVKYQLDEELQTLKQSNTLVRQGLELIGNSAWVVSARLAIERVAPTQIRVLLTGPVGSGKTVIARLLHQQSQRANQPFVSLHCGALTPEQLDAELFGYAEKELSDEKAVLGCLRQANGGTLLLEHVEQLPLALQQKLYRALKEGRFFPPKSIEAETFELRLITATSENLAQRVRHGLFQEDLYYYLKGVAIDTVALSRCREDIPLLVRYFLQLLSEEKGLPFTIEPAAMRWFLQRSWLGNVRELKNTLEAVAAIAEHSELRLTDIQLLRLDKPVTSEGSNLLDNLLINGLDEQVKALEIRLIEHALQENRGNKSRASRMLGISRQGLLKKLERYGLTSGKSV